VDTLVLLPTRRVNWRGHGTADSRPLVTIAIMSVVDDLRHREKDGTDLHRLRTDNQQKEQSAGTQGFDPLS
jgi:hypothetical protein